MPDRKKVISDLEYLISEDCTDTQFDYIESIQDALELLKEQEQDRIEIAHEMVSNSILMYQGKEIVRCKDCKHHGTIYCPMCEEADYVFNTADNWFCADGVKRDD